MNSNIKLSVITIFSVVLLAGFASVGYTQLILALSIGGIELDELDGLPGLEALQGPKGDKGDPGPPGQDGKDGSQGERGQKGDKGDKGDQGIQGIQGETGTEGEQGAQGIQGERGEKGNKGDTGDTGPQGEQGPKGDKGDPGTSGPPIGFLNVKKNVIGDNRPASDFRINIEGNNPSKSTISGSTEGVDVVLGEGHYIVTEQPRNGYTTTYSEGCEGYITMNSQRESCTVTNTATGKGEIRVIVSVTEEGCSRPLGINCPDPKPSDFTIEVSGKNPSPSRFSGGDQTVTLDPGIYNVGVIFPPGNWNPDLSEDCSDQILAGQQKTCSIHIRGAHR